MAIKRSGEGTYQVENYFCDTTDLKANWPTNCAASSTMTVVNATTDVVDHYEVFDGTAWNVI